MPLQRCGNGWKWGNSGKCYDNKMDAIKQALAIGGGKMPVEKGDSDVAIMIDITKNDSDRQLAFGWANVSASGGELVVDSHGDTISLDELENAAYNFNLNFHGEAVGEMHKGDSKGRLVESFVVTPEKLEKMGLAKDALPHGWWVGMYVEDKELFDKVKSGQYRAFSIQGMAKRVK